MQIYLIRHGETEWSASGQHTGWTDLPLTPRGEQQARALQPALQDLKFSRVLTSPLQRAQQTCSLAGLGSLAEITPDLHEWDYGAYEGRTPTSIRQERRGWNVFQDGCPDGESPADVSNRADRLIQQLAKETGPIALFSHGHFSRGLAVRWIDLPLASAANLSLCTASISLLGTHPADPELRLLELWNLVPSLPSATARCSDVHDSERVDPAIVTR